MQLISETEIAARYPFAEGTLQNRRYKGKPLLPYIKKGGKVLYDPDEVERHLKEATVFPKPNGQ